MTRTYAYNERTPSETRFCNVHVNISIQLLDDFLHATSLPRPKLYPPHKEADPIIDVFDDKENLKIVALFPGVKKEDIRFKIKEGFIELEIRKDGQTYRREIPCNVKPNQVLTRSTTFNNSVLEIVFRKV